MANKNNQTGSKKGTFRRETSIQKTPTFFFTLIKKERARVVIESLGMIRITLRKILLALSKDPTLLHKQVNQKGHTKDTILTLLYPITITLVGVIIIIIGSALVKFGTQKSILEVKLQLSMIALKTLVVATEEMTLKTVF